MLTGLLAILDFKNILIAISVGLLIAAAGYRYQAQGLEAELFETKALARKATATVDTLTAELTLERDKVGRMQTEATATQRKLSRISAEAARKLAAAKRQPPAVVIHRDAACEQVREALVQVAPKLDWPQESAGK